MYRKLIVELYRRLRDNSVALNHMVEGWADCSDITTWMVYWFADGWDGAGEGAQAGAYQDPDEPGEGARRGELRSDR